MKRRERTSSAKGFCNTRLSEIRLEESLQTKDLVCIMSWKHYKGVFYKGEIITRVHTSICMN